MPAPAPNFDRVARIYRWAEYLSFGRLLERTREHFLPQLTGCTNALAIGDGDGRFLALLLQQNPQVQATAADTSATMLHLLRNRCQPFANRLQTVQASALHIDFDPQIDLAKVDLIVTHFFLDCLTQQQVDAMTLRLSTQIASGTLWLVSDFALPHSRALKPFAALYIRLLYLAFRILTGLRVTRLPDPQTALANANFRRIARHARLGGLLYTEIWQRQ